MAQVHETPSPADEHHVGHVVPFKILFAVFAALTLLTLITVGASYIDFGELNLIVALVIAVIKASLVVLFFMHLRWDRPFNAIVFVGCLIFVAIFLGFALIDTTQYHHSIFTEQAPGMKAHIPMKAEKLPG
ncbi:MAG TPA: cytochrome C oxidase subunit IV family protein [Phycisphaerae bacterium]|nr:cytochrome C oxidase subunit IV family protein [Phycisphaerae bacterium]